MSTTTKKERKCIKGLFVKEDDDSDLKYITIATTHPDRAGGSYEGVDYDGDILSEEVMDQIVTYTNDESTVGGSDGAYRQISLFHDWIKEGDPTLPPAGIVVGDAEKVKYEDGHFGVVVPYEVNKFLDTEVGEQHYNAERVAYEIEKNIIAGGSIEFNNNDEDCKLVELGDNTYRFIDKISEYGGFGFARGRLIANPKAVALKEIVSKIKKTKEGDNMPPEDKKKKKEEETKDSETDNKKEEEDSKSEEKTEEKKAKKKTESKEVETKEETKLDVKEIAEQVKEIALKNLEDVEVKNKVIKEAKKMDTKEIPLSIKEMKESLTGQKQNLPQFKESARAYFAENKELDLKLKEAYESTGIILRPKMKIECSGTKEAHPFYGKEFKETTLRIVGGLQTKDTLDTTTNPGAYTESIVEFADLFIPGLIETFNNQANLFGAMRKVNHLMGGQFYGWKLKTDQASSLSVDPDDPTVVKDPVDKIKIRTDIKEKRIGVSVTDYVLHHSRATMGDLLMLEAEARMNDLMRDVNNDLFTEQVDDGIQCIGLEAVADSAGNTSIYGKTRSTANRLAPATATDTYTAVGGALTTDNIRLANRKVEVEGALRQNLRMITNPTQRDKLFELEDGNQRYFQAPQFGFNGEIYYDGVPLIIDSSCQTDAIFVVDWASYYIVVSRAPQLIGLAKVGAAEEAYISMYYAVVYEQPRRVYMLDTLTT